MSLEIALQENTAAVKELAALLTRLNVPYPGKTEGIVGGLVESTKENLEVQAPKSSPSTGTTKGSKASSAPSDSGESTKPLSYEADVKPKAIALSKKSIGAFKEVLGAFDLVKFPDAKPEQYAEIVRALDEKLAA